MALKLTVEIVSHERIKPRSPTPPSLHNYKFSHMDQLCPHDQYVSYLLFYSNIAATAAATTTEYDDVMKNALAETLTRMYPLAGRANDDCMSIDCNDDGTEYIITRVNESMSTVLENPKTHFLQQLLPINLSSTWRPITTSAATGSSSDQLPLVAIQINHFSCSGVAIGACVRHNVADASAASSFLQMWAAISCGDDQKYNVPDREKVIFNGQTTLFPPHDDLEVFKSIWKRHDLSSREVSHSHVNKLLVFDGPKVSALTEQNPSRTTTRVQAVTAFLWAATISAARDRNQQLEMHMLYTPVNLRNKVDPPLPAHSLGNILHLATAMWKKTQESDGHQSDLVLQQLQDQLKNSIDMVTEDFVRKVHEDPRRYLPNLIAGIESMAKSRQVVESFGAVSWCRFPFYETDFGWGKPVWVATLAPQKDSAILFDTSDGGGIQAWLSLPKQDMEKLEKDPNFLAYVSAIHTL